MQLPSDVTHKQGTESVLYTLMRRHQTTLQSYERLAAEEGLAEAAKPVIEELITVHRNAHDRAGELLKDFPGSPVKPNTQMQDGHGNETPYPTNLAEAKLIYPYLRDEEDAIMHLYADLAKRGGFPDMINTFISENQHAVMENYNRLDFKAKAR